MQTGTGPYGLIETVLLRCPGNTSRTLELDPVHPIAGDVDSRRIDCGGRLITPGLIDCHTHLSMVAIEQANSSCAAGTSYADIAAAGGGIHRPFKLPEMKPKMFCLMPLVNGFNE
ncbi:MAG: hypothetical protein CM1200mP18_15610 [Gammaproteobacteria bacterium]|nr:MAG: hypothetical protein CM1200mP18_15610 [Gammaproteobacteria bacterium]